jgi:uncharacterized protein YjiS (DUF1127 family)
MTTTDYTAIPATMPENQLRPASLLRGWLSGWRRRRAERLALLELSRLDARLLRDIGIHPADVQDALYGRGSSVWLDPMRRSGQE